MNKIVINLAPEVLKNDKELGSAHRLKEGDPYNFQDVKLKFVKVGPINKFDPLDLASMSDYLKSEVEKDPKLEIMLRADGALRYADVQPVMEAVTRAGVKKVHMVTYLLEQDF